MLSLRRLVISRVVDVIGLANLVGHLFEQLASVARLKAEECCDPDLTMRLREEAMKHERKAQQLRRAGRWR